MANALLGQLIAALEELAKPADEQLGHVDALGVDIDELALEFDDVAPTRDALVDKGVISRDQSDAVAAVDRKLDRMSDAGPSRWTEGALRTGEDWQELRLLAMRALTALARPLVEDP